MGAPIHIRPTEHRAALAFTAALAGCHDQAELFTRIGELADLVGCDKLSVNTRVAATRAALDATRDLS